MKKAITVLIIAFALNISAFCASSKLEYLAKAISQEMGGEPFIVRVMYGEMLLNRLESEEYPDTLPAICFSMGINVRNAKPDASDMRAASAALCGLGFSCGALNVRKVEKRSIPQSRDGILLYDWYFY